ncbi:MAG: serine/threonine protein phosphatase [Candidatus Baldrarchaeia archaeon]
MDAWKVEEFLKKPEKLTKLKFKDVVDIISACKDIISSETSLVEIDLRDWAVVAGDTHGDLYSTIDIIRLYLNNKDECEYLIFLGDYVDRGYYQVENIVLVLLLKLEFPERVILLRGNHEGPEANRYYGFYDETCSRYGLEMYEEFSDLFAYLPYAVLINGEILGLHGGLAKGLETLDQIRKIPKGLIEPSQHDLAFQILWNDPRDGLRGFAPSMRGPGIYYFGEDVFDRFAERNGISMIVRAHEVFPRGYRFFFGGKVLSIFSARNYGIPVEARVAHIRKGGQEVIPEVF